MEIKIKNKNRQAGFTLIEMLVVVAVIGILSTVLLNTLGPARDKAKDSRIIEEVNQVRNLAEVLYDGDYEALEELPKQTGETINNTQLRLLAEDIEKQGGELHIIVSDDKRNYVAFSPLNIMVGAEPDLKVNYYCIDSSGHSVFTTVMPSDKDETCPL